MWQVWEYALHILLCVSIAFEKWEIQSEDTVTDLWVWDPDFS